MAKATLEMKPSEGLSQETIEALYTYDIEQVEFRVVADDDE